MNAYPVNLLNESIGMAPSTAASYSVVPHHSHPTASSAYGKNGSGQESWDAPHWGDLRSSLHAGSLALTICASRSVASPLVTTQAGLAGNPEEEGGAFRRCIYFASGGCRNGTACGFAHDTATMAATSAAVPVALQDGMAGAYPGSFASLQAAAAAAADCGVFATRSLMEALPSAEFHRQLLLAGSTSMSASMQASGMKAVAQSSMSSALVYPAPEDSGTSTASNSGGDSCSNSSGVSSASVQEQMLLCTYRSDHGKVRSSKSAPLSPSLNASLQQQQQQQQVVTGQVASNQADQTGGVSAADEQPATSAPGGDGTQASSPAPGTATQFKERPDLAPPCPQSRQIYMTFTADSVFVEQDVASYFRWVDEIASYNSLVITHW